MKAVALALSLFVISTGHLAHATDRDAELVQALQDIHDYRPGSPADRKVVKWAIAYAAFTTGMTVAASFTTRSHGIRDTVEVIGSAGVLILPGFGLWYAIDRNRSLQRRGQLYAEAKQRGRVDVEGGRSSNRS